MCVIRLYMLPFSNINFFRGISRMRHHCYVAASSRNNKKFNKVWTIKKIENMQKRRWMFNFLFARWSVFFFAALNTAYQRRWNSFIPFWTGLNTCAECKADADAPCPSLVHCCCHFNFAVARDLIRAIVFNCISSHHCPKHILTINVVSSCKK